MKHQETSSGSESQKTTETQSGISHFTLFSFLIHHFISKIKAFFSAGVSNNSISGGRSFVLAGLLTVFDCPASSHVHNTSPYR